MMSRLACLVLVLGLLRQAAAAAAYETANTTDPVETDHASSETDHTAQSAESVEVADTVETSHKAEGNKPSDDYILQAFEHSVYNKHAKPDTSQGPVMVRFKPTVDKVVDLDVDSQVLTVHLLLRMSWKDSRVKKFFDDFGVHHRLITSIKKLWTPDIWLYNSADSNEGDFGDVHANLDPDGTVLWVPSLALRSYCKVDYDVMEGDRVNCTMKFGSWVYSSKDVDFEEVGELEKTVPELSRMFNMTSNHLVRTETVYACCPDTYVTKDLVLELERTAFVKN